MKLKATFAFLCIAAVVAPGLPIQAEQTYGNAEDPLVATIMGMDIRTGDPEEMRYVILAKLTDGYAAEHGVQVSREDIDAYLAGMRRVAEEERRRHLARREALTRQLAAEGLSEAEKESISSELASLNELIANLDESNSPAEEDSEEIRQYREQVATAFIRQWKINKALYEQYGGRIIFQQGGPEPLDAYRRFLESQEKAGSFKILDETFEQKFWNYYRNDAIHSFYPKGSKAETRAFETPWWLLEAAPK
jgi:hypothetical protein